MADSSWTFGKDIVQVAAACQVLFGRRTNELATVRKHTLTPVLPKTLWETFVVVQEAASFKLEATEQKVVRRGNYRELPQRERLVEHRRPGEQTKGIFKQDRQD